MKADLVNLTYEIEVGPGEKLTLPDSLVESIGPGRWRLTIQAADDQEQVIPVRQHSAFLNSYIAEDEGLYDDYPAR